MNNIYIENVKRKMERLKKQHPNSEIIDVTSKSIMPWRKFSPFYNHEKIPVPGMNNVYAKSVEGIWQGLKEFDQFSFDPNYFMRYDSGIKRTVKSFGNVKGHKFEKEIINYTDARVKIFIPTYIYVLQNYLLNEIDIIIRQLELTDIVFLDYTTNDDIFNSKKALSHAAVLRDFIHERIGYKETKKEDNQFKLLL